MKINGKYYNYKVIEFKQGMIFSVTYTDKIEDPELKKFVIDMTKNIEDDRRKELDDDVLDHVENMDLMEEGRKCLAVYGPDEEFIGKVDFIRYDNEHRLNCGNLYAAGRRTRAERQNKNFTESPLIIWALAVLYACEIYGDAASILIPLPNPTELKLLERIGCTPVRTLKNINSDNDIDVKIVSNIKTFADSEGAKKSIHRFDSRGLLLLPQIFFARVMEFPEEFNM